MMASMNRSIVQRSFGLNEFASAFARALYGAEPAGAIEAVAARQATYGPQFRYAEYSVVGSWFQTVWFSLITQWSIALLSTFPPIRWFVKTFGTKPGAGPSEEEMEGGRMLVTNYTQSATSPDIVVKSVMRGDADPGYLLTSYIVVECALALVLDDAALPPLAHLGGILTPATALGEVLVKRLENTGRIRFESEVVHSEGVERRKEQ
ncbi:hypothetical protein C8Q74DRAFT_393402 [Fomes fomentarius]|nr:hypothetical protein C8Q74DRAFT_393402 [Fomes fomentarius]